MRNKIVRIKALQKDDAFYEDRELFENRRMLLTPRGYFKLISKRSQLAAQKKLGTGADFEYCFLSNIQYEPCR